MPDRSGSFGDGEVSVVSPGAYAVSDNGGDIEPSGGGLFYGDVRHLSRFVIEVNGERPVGMGSVTRGSGAEFSLSAGKVSVSRRRTLGAGMVDEVLFTNESRGKIEAVVSVECDADFEDIFAVRGYGRVSERGEVSREATDVCLRYEYRRGEFRRGEFRRGTTLRVSGAEANFEPGRVSFGLRLGPGETRTVSVSVALEESGETVTVERAPLYAGAPGLETEWEAVRTSWTRSVEDLESLTFDAGDGLLVPAAGAPWYMALFGRDSLITAYQVMILSPEPAKNTLLALARYQAAERDDFTDAEPGKIPHELRRGEMAFFGETPETPYYGTVDATPLFLVLLHEVWRWTADTEFVREMEEAARRALGWILDHSDKVDGYVAYRKRSSAGLVNHSWKDSADSMLFRDGTRAEGPIAPVEVQGYVYDALLGTAAISESVWDDADLAAELRRRAADLKERFDRDFWLEDLGYYALALDGEGRKIDSITSNPGHLLWNGIVPVDKARLVADRLMDETLFSGWGIRTMAAGEGGYDPTSYHNGSVWPHDNAIVVHGLRRYGFVEEAERVTVALLDAAAHFDHRLPELFAGYSRQEAPGPVEYPTSCSPQAWAAGTIPLLVRAALGAEPDPKHRTLLVDPAACAEGWRLGGVPAFGERRDIRV